MVSEIDHEQAMYGTRPIRGVIIMLIGVFAITAAQPLYGTLPQQTQAALGLVGMLTISLGMFEIAVSPMFQTLLERALRGLGSARSS